MPLRLPQVSSYSGGVENTMRYYPHLFSAKSVLNACDYGGPDGCHGKVEVVIKISYDRRKFQREKDVYECLATVKSCPPYVPHLYFGESYRCSRFYGLVLSKLGPDLETLRRRRLDKRFTPRMTLAVAIQTVFYSSLFFYLISSCD